MTSHTSKSSCSIYEIVNLLQMPVLLHYLNVKLSHENANGKGQQAKYQERVLLSFIPDPSLILDRNFKTEGFCA